LAESRFAGAALDVHLKVGDGEALEGDGSAHDVRQVDECLRALKERENGWHAWLENEEGQKCTRTRFWSTMSTMTTRRL
jgi:LPS sulfotransferase NodH